MAVADYFDTVQKIYIAYYQRPADPTGLRYWAGILNANGGDLSAMIDAFAGEPESQDLYGEITAENFDAFLDSIYMALYNRAPDDEGRAFWNEAFADGTYTPAQIVLAILDGAQNDDAVAVANKLQVSNAFTEQVDGRPLTDPTFGQGSSFNATYEGEADAIAAREMLAGVTSSPASVFSEAQVRAFIQGSIADAGDPILSDLSGQTINLTVGQDTLLGTSENDTFKANVVQNDGGAQVNTLGSGDELNGLGGTDTLNAKLAAGVFAGGSWSMPIQPETQSIEIVNLEAVLSDVNGEFGADDQVFVNAKDMQDVEQIWSNRSDADLTIMNMTTQGLEQLSDLTVGMAYTGNRDSRWEESDYSVYFDQDYLTPETTRTNPTVEFLAMNEDNFDASNGARPLEGVFFRELQFRLNGQTFDLTEFLGEDPDGAGAEITTYPEFLAAVQAALVQLKAANPGNAALQSVVATLGSQFDTDVNPITLEVRTGTAIRLSVDGLTNGVENTLSVQSTDLEVARAAAATVPNNNRYELAEVFDPVEGGKLGINVALEKVGLAGDGGELVIGSMNKQLVDLVDNDGGNSGDGSADAGSASNIWDAVRTTVEGTTSGIEEFYVTVQGDASKSSSLAALHSTNNNLRVVTVATDAAVSGANGYADLTIGNSNTDTEVGIDGLGIVANLPHSPLPTLGAAASLKDVQTFDASAFKGDLHLHAALTREVADKYLNLVDEAPAAPGADNVVFDYIGGEGDDYLNIALDTDNSAFSGTITREDFVMNLSVAGGAGDDEIVLGMANAEGLDNAAAGDPAPDDEEEMANWYLNHKALANVRIDGGEGDDTIWTPGSGDVIIDAGTGNDTVYADNTGNGSQWVLNYRDPDSDVGDIESGANHEYNLFKTSVVVSFNGFEASAAIVDVRGVADDLAINQAVKAAINSDPVLSKLLVAADGPGFTLVVTSLIDGSQVGALSVTLDTPEAAQLTAGDVNNLALWYDTPGLTAAQAAAAFAAVAAEFNDPDLNGTYLLDLDTDGDDSDHVSDNTITGDLGNDVLVLGTGAFSNDTVVYEGAGNGVDSIVNFVASELVTTIITADNPVEVEVTNQGSAGSGATGPVAATFELKFSAATAGGNVVFTDEDVFGDLGVGNLSVPVLAGDTAAVVAGKILAAWPLTSDYSVALDPADPSNLLFTETTPTGTTTPTQADILDAVDGTSAGVLETVENIIAGSFDTPPVAPSTEAIAVTFGAPTINGLFQFDGDEFPILEGDTALDVANTFAAGDFDNWTVSGLPVTNLDGTVTVNLVWTAGPADVADVTIANFTGDINLNAEVIETLVPTDDIDYLDFSAYGVAGVYVDGELVAGVAPDADNDLYLTLTEDADNAGEYLMEVWNIGANNVLDYRDAVAPEDDVLVTSIGVADFGATQGFVAENFII